MNAKITTQAFFDPETWTVTYVVSDNQSGHAAIIDPVLDYDFKSGRTSTASADRVRAYLADKGLQVDWILETHAHADHLSGAHYLKAHVGGRIAIGENICVVQSTFKAVFNLERSFLPDGSQFDHLFKEGETFKIGEVEATALLVPGHTPADMAYRVEDSVFVGDTLFMPDVGTARADFPGGDVHALYRSIRRLFRSWRGSSRRSARTSAHYLVSLLAKSRTASGRMRPRRRWPRASTGSTTFSTTSPRPLVTV